MANINKIKTEGKWVDIARDINRNFANLNLERNVKLPLFDSLETVGEIQKYDGALILIGTSMPLKYHKWNGIKWADTGMTFSSPNLNLNDYATKGDLDNKADVTAITSLEGQISQLLNQISSLQRQVDDLIAGGVIPPSPTPEITDALILTDGSYLELKDGSYLKLKQ